MANFLLALKYLGVVLEVVKQVEAALPNTPGATKLKVAVELLTALDEGVKALLPQLTVLINATVSAFNAAGVFKTAGAPKEL